VSWVKVEDENPNLVEGGRAGNEQIFYICRGVFRSLLIIGKYYAADKCCYIGYYGEEHCTKDFLILALKD
jgi:Protein of unknown function (DUF3421)